MNNLVRLSDWEARLATHNLWVRCYRESGSTMDLARNDIFLQTEKPYGLVLTRMQTTGRGRQGRSWQPPAKGFFATYCIVTKKRVSELSGFSLVVGYVISEVLKGIGLKVKLKWPNDIYSCDYKKLAGILVEIAYNGDGTGVLTGIGLNLMGEPSGVDATSYATLTGHEIDELSIAELLSAPFFDAWEEFERHGFSSFRKRWLNHALYVDQEISVEIGGVLRKGIFKGVDEIGQMLFDERGQVSHVSSAEIINLRKS